MTDLFFEDSTNAYGLQPGMFGYAGYFNGPFANLSSIRSRFPGKPVMGYATRLGSSHGADAIDCEPGTLGGDFASNAVGAAIFIRAWTGGSGLFSKPVVYCMASWLSSMETYLAGRGIPRSSYYLNSAHPNGLHFCGPNSCGYGHSQADLTQFEFASSFDKTVAHSYVLKGSGSLPVPPVPPVISSLPGTVVQGSTGKDVVLLRVHLDAWGAHLPANADGAHDAFGPQVLAAVKSFQKAQKLVADGVVGPQTWAAVLARPPAPVHPFPVPPVPAPSHKALHQGDKGADVKVLQAALNQHGASPKLMVDGDFGPVTARDVRWFQGRHGLAETTVVDARTWAYLLA